MPWRSPMTVICFDNDVEAWTTLDWFLRTRRVSCSNCRRYRAWSNWKKVEMKLLDEIFYMINNYISRYIFHGYKTLLQEGPVVTYISAVTIVGHISDFELSGIQWCFCWVLWENDMIIGILHQCISCIQHMSYSKADAYVGNINTLRPK